MLLADDEMLDDVVLEQLLMDEEDEREELRSIHAAGPFILNEQTNEWCIDNCRFDKNDLHDLIQRLGLPEEIILDNGSRVGRIEAVCILLCRLSYLSRFLDRSRTFGREKTMLCRIFNKTLNLLYDIHRHRLTNLHHRYVDFNNLTAQASAICPMDNVIGFIDGTVRPMCRPGVDQEECYNGHKRIHAVKFQSVVFIDGIIACLHGPYEGRRHDSFLLRESGILDQLQELPVMADGRQYCLYGDPAYPVLPQLIPPFRGHLTADQTLFNERMSNVRESVEYGFGKVVQYFPFVDFKKNLKLHLSPVGKIYLVAAFLTNCHTAYYGCAINSLTGSSHPSIVQYLS